MPVGEAPGALDFSPLLGSTTISYVKRATLTTGEGDTRDASDLISVFTVCDYSRSEYIEVLGIRLRPSKKRNDGRRSRAAPTRVRPWPVRRY